MLPAKRHAALRKEEVPQCFPEYAGKQERNRNTLTTAAAAPQLKLSDAGLDTREIMADSGLATEIRRPDESGATSSLLHN